MQRTLRPDTPAGTAETPAHPELRRFAEPTGLAEPNGGFPEPPAGVPVRIVRAHHQRCETDTLVRLPRHVGPATVRRVICRDCAASFDAANVEVVAGLEPTPEVARPKPQRWLRDHAGRGWRLLSIPLAAAAVVGGLLLVQGSDDAGQPPVAKTPQGAGDAAAAEGADAPRGASKGGGGTGGANARLVSESNFTLALPPGWEQLPAKAGATFSATAVGGDAEATLWIEREPKLDFATFEARSLDQLRALAGSARVVERIAGPTAEATVIRLAADAPKGSPAYEATLRVAGPYRYYLATIVQPNASPEATDGSDLIQSSFVPVGGSQPTDGAEGK